jgi:SAM-dependent methyltransferase
MMKTMLELLKTRKPTSGAPRVVCPHCGYAASMITGASCPDCGTPVASYDKATLQEAYDVEPVDVSFERSDHPPRLGAPDRTLAQIRILEQRLDLRRLKTVTDVGCGHNWLLSGLAERYPNLSCTGYDFAPHEPEGPAADRVKVQFFDLETAKLPLESGSQDLVICSHSLEHIDNAHLLLNEVLRVGKNALVVLPNDLAFTTLLKTVLTDGPRGRSGIPLERPQDRHRWVFTPRLAERWMRHAAGHYGKQLYIHYFSDPRLPAAFGKIHRNLFVSETAFVFKES